MKKIYSIMAILLLCVALTGCSQAGSQSEAGTEDKISQNKSDSVADASEESPQANTGGTENAGVAQPTESLADTEFDLEKGTVLLNNGTTMPILGIGTFRLSDEQAENTVYWALRNCLKITFNIACPFLRYQIVKTITQKSVT